MFARTDPIRTRLADVVARMIRGERISTTGASFVRFLGCGALPERVKTQSTADTAHTQSERAPCCHRIRKGARYPYHRWSFQAWSHLKRGIVLRPCHGLSLPLEEQDQDSCGDSGYVPAKPCQVGRCITEKAGGRRHHQVVTADETDLLWGCW